jgi:hypothetical protein
MDPFSFVPAVGYTGLAVLVIAWLVVSFTQPSPRRAVIEWIAACGMYVALLSLFVHMLGRSLASDSTVGTIGFGVLTAFFGAGLVLCAVQMARSLRGPREAASSATN